MYNYRNIGNHSKSIFLVSIKPEIYHTVHILIWEGPSYYWMIHCNIINKLYIIVFNIT